jgi:MoaA/NifB/PqqE/SkfB family radical SAM enzyme
VPRNSKWIKTNNGINIEKYAEEENVLEFYGGEPTLHKDELFKTSRNTN